MRKKTFIGKVRIMGNTCRNGGNEEKGRKGAKAGREERLYRKLPGRPCKRRGGKGEKNRKSKNRGEKQDSESNSETRLEGRIIRLRLK